MLLWMLTFVLVVGFLGLSLDVALLLSFGALLMQYAVIYLTAQR